MRWQGAMAETTSPLEGIISTITQNPTYLILTIGGLALLIILIVARHIHKIRSEEIFIHQAWGANWKGR
jgi:hypothetical protein